MNSSGYALSVPGNETTNGKGDIMVATYTTGRAFLARLPHAADLLDAIRQVCIDNQVKMATVAVIGALTKVTLGYYNQEGKEYLNRTLSGGYEIVSLTGNLSLKEGEPMVHAHLVISDDKGNCLAGHLMSPSTIFAGELFIQELQGKQLNRHYDQTTGLHLWQF